jgi:hypothetical protein
VSLAPALSPEEWVAAYEPEYDATLGFHPLHTELVAAADHGHYHKAAALANAALPAGSPAQLTSETVSRLRGAAMMLRRVATAVQAGSQLDASVAELLNSATGLDEESQRIEYLLPPQR